MRQFHRHRLPMLVSLAVCLLAILGQVPTGQAQQADEHGAAAANGHESGDSHAAGSADAHEAGEAGHGDSHGGHDPTDLSHQNATDMIENPAEWKSDLALWTFAVFLLLLLVLAKFAWGPIIAGLEKREQGIAAMIEEAQHSAEQAAKQLQQYEAKLAAATEESKGILAEARRDADAARERIVAEAQETAARERQRAIDDITTAKQGAVQEITERSVELAVAMAGQLIRREVSVEDRAKLVRDALDEIPSQN